MDMATGAASSVMSMPMSSATSMPMSSTMPAAAATSAAMGMGSSGSSMDMDMGAGACKINMLWNWYTIDACFLSSSWHITSKGMFAGSCIGVILLVCSLEFLRRLAREYDRYIATTAARRPTNSAAMRRSRKANQGAESSHTKTAMTSNAEERMGSSSDEEADGGLLSGIRSGRGHVRPTLLQQVIRATLHMLQFGVAYFIMLLAMYYNGYFIICILIGAWIGGFLFSWDGREEEVTSCCG